MSALPGRREKALILREWPLLLSLATAAVFAALGTALSGIRPTEDAVDARRGLHVDEWRPCLNSTKTRSMDASATYMDGDREHDMRGAKANGIRGIGALWGYGSREELLSAGAAALCEQPASLCEVLAL